VRIVDTARAVMIQRGQQFGTKRRLMEEQCVGVEGGLTPVRDGGRSRFSGGDGVTQGPARRGNDSKGPR